MPLHKNSRHDLTVWVRACLFDLFPDECPASRCVSDLGRWLFQLLALFVTSMLPGPGRRAFVAVLCPGQVAHPAAGSDRSSIPQLWEKRRRELDWSSQRNFREQENIVGCLFIKTRRPAASQHHGTSPWCVRNQRLTPCGARAVFLCGWGPEGLHSYWVIGLWLSIFTSDDRGWFFLDLHLHFRRSTAAASNAYAAQQGCNVLSGLFFTLYKADKFSLARRSWTGAFFFPSSFLFWFSYFNLRSIFFCFVSFFFASLFLQYFRGESPDLPFATG